MRKAREWNKAFAGRCPLVCHPINPPIQGTIWALGRTHPTNIKFYLVKANVERTLAQVAPNADPDGLEIVRTSVSLSGT